MNSAVEPWSSWFCCNLCRSQHVCGSLASRIAESWEAYDWNYDLLTPKRHEIWIPVEHGTRLARIQSFWSQHAGALGRAFSEMIFFLAHSLNWSGWPSNADSNPMLFATSHSYLLHLCCFMLHVICLLQHISSTFNGDAIMPAWMCSLQPRRVTMLRHIKTIQDHNCIWDSVEWFEEMKDHFTSWDVRSIHTHYSHILFTTVPRY